MSGASASVRAFLWTLLGTSGGCPRGEPEDRACGRAYNSVTTRCRGTLGRATQDVQAIRPSACSAQTLPSPGRDIAPHESHDTPRRRAGGSVRTPAGPPPVGETTRVHGRRQGAVDDDEGRRRDDGARGPGTTPNRRAQTPSDPPRRGRRDCADWSVNRIGRVRRSPSAPSGAVQPSLTRLLRPRRSRGLRDDRNQSGVRRSVTAAVAGGTVAPGHTRLRDGGSALGCPATAHGRHLGGLGGTATAGRRRLDEFGRATTAHGRELCRLVRGAAAAGRRQVGHDGEVPARATAPRSAGHRRPRPGGGRTGAGPPTSPAWRARGRPPRTAPPTGGAPAGAGWRGRSRPSPRRHRGRRGPTPGRTRRHRAASRAVRPPTRFRPDRPRQPGADS